MIEHSNGSSGMIIEHSIVNGMIIEHSIVNGMMIEHSIGNVMIIKPSIGNDMVKGSDDCIHTTPRPHSLIAYAGHHHGMIVCIPVTMGVEKLKCESWPAVTELQ